MFISGNHVDISGLSDSSNHISLSTGKNNQIQGMALLTPSGVGFCFDGLESAFGDELITLQVVKGKTQLWVFSDKDNESPTHTINLSAGDQLCESNHYRTFSITEGPGKGAAEGVISCFHGNVIISLSRAGGEPSIACTFKIHGDFLIIKSVQENGSENSEKIDFHLALV
jgi:hypothetical protein